MSIVHELNVVRSVSPTSVWLICTQSTQYINLMLQSKAHNSSIWFNKVLDIDINNSTYTGKAHREHNIINHPEPN
jgi:hypothetical protein